MKKVIGEKMWNPQHVGVSPPGCGARGRIIYSYRKGYAPGYASGNFSKISKFFKNSPRLCPQATPQGK
ncbi:hypothetical protein T12_669 [Trichinella patagoniensis]|uniref:Uncharacterized protein n=1 Tax=Trichinella patagoniensis TaxID=990121 RepID=A0A0V0ZWQ5_9BILA|nr:hypothetical protein T12_669 [Trichinella patagoniensis]